MQKLQKRRYLARNIRALRCRIRYSFERIQGAVAWMIFRAFPMATRISSTRTAMTRAGGSTPITTTLTTGGIVTMVSLSFRKFFHFSLAFTAGEFCFWSCPFQPPSIFPISSIFTDRAIYFLSSIDFASHSTIKSIFKVSIFLIANRTHGLFSSRDKKVAVEIASIISINKISIFCPREYLCILGKVW